MNDAREKWIETHPVPEGLTRCAWVGEPEAVLRRALAEAERAGRCCDAMIAAQERETDNEGYGALIYHDPPRLRMGNSERLPAIRFCPWCGKDVLSRT